MKIEERKRKITNAFDRIACLINSLRLPVSAKIRMREQIEDERRTVLEFVDCNCAEPKEPRASGTVEIESEPWTHLAVYNGWGVRCREVSTPGGAMWIAEGVEGMVHRTSFDFGIWPIRK